MFWIGVLILIPLHILRFIFWVAPKAVVYTLLYDKVLRHVTKHDSIAAFLIWLMILAVVFFTRLEYLMPSVLIAFAVLISIAAIVIVLAAFIVMGVYSVLHWLWEKAIEPVIKFDWQIYRRYYVPKYRLPDEKYQYDHGQNQLVLHILVWLQLALLFLVPYGSTRVITGQPMPSSVCIQLLGIFVAFYTVVTAILLLYLRHEEKELLYERHPELRPRSKPKKTKQPKKKAGTGISSWELFIVWLKAKKQKVCPLVEFVD